MSQNVNFQTMPPIHDDKKSLPVFAMLPPFPETSPYANVHVFLERIEKELSTNIKTYSYKQSAFDHDVFIINDSVVVRFPKTLRGRNHLNHEIAFLSFLKNRVKINIPHYSYISKNADFAGYDIIKGGVLTPSSFRHLRKKDKETAVHQLIEFINDFHRISLNDFATYKPRRREDFIAVEKVIEHALKEKLFPKLSQKEVDQITYFYQESKKYLQKIPSSCATHGDLYAYNVIWDKDKSEIGVIDFSDYLVGDPAKDFEVFYNYRPKYAEIAYEKYKGPKDNDFLQRAKNYYKVHAIYTLLSSMCGARISFDVAHKRYIKRMALR